ncbi:MAG TPA: NADH-quinone oxidoreductase subunit F, partial [Thermoplasmata archaeon]|nr:NADH-quinone oxidoreductase subunit F [Thermoplasmata archaeon]
MCCLEPMIYVQAHGRPPVVFGPLEPRDVAPLLDATLVHRDYPPDRLLGALGEGFEGVPSIWGHPIMRGQHRIITENNGIIDPERIDHYLARGGYRGLRRALDMSPEEVIETVTAAGLRGRGGAGFPTGLKWRYCRQVSTDRRYIVCNADEGDPGAFMDRSILEGDPFRVIEGMAIAAYAIGAGEGYVYIRAEYPLAIDHLRKAIRQAEAEGFLGDDIMGSEFDFHLHIKEGAGAFVCGEETALLASIEGRRGMPRPRPPFPAQKGLWGMPTVINNVKTLS